MGYERAFNDSWTGLIHVAAGGFSYDLGPDYGKTGAFAFQVDAHGRWYFFKTALDKPFVDLGIGYEYYGYSYTSHSDWGWNQRSLTIPPKVGWKFIFGKWFVLEPAIGWTFGIPLGKPDNLYGAAAYKAGGFNLGIALGGGF